MYTRDRGIALLALRNTREATACKQRLEQSSILYPGIEVAYDGGSSEAAEAAPEMATQPTPATTAISGWRGRVSAAGAAFAGKARALTRRLSLRAGRQAPPNSVTRLAAQRVMAFIKPIEEFVDIWMTNRAVLAVRHQILLAHIGGVVTVRVFRQQMIEWLVLVRTHLWRDRLIPFIGIVEFGIDVDDHAPDRIEAMTNDFADTEFGLSVLHEGKSGAAGDGNTSSSARLEAFLHLHDLAAAIHAGLQVEVMRTVKFAGRLVLDIGIALQGVMSAAHVALRARDL